LVEDLMSAKLVPVLVLAAMLAGCAATGPRYAETAASSTSVPDEASRLVVYRSAAHRQYAGAAAEVKLEGTALGSCDYEGFATFDVPAGIHVLGIDAASTIGKCEITIDVSGGNRYYYEISPRVEHYVASMPGLVISAFGPVGFIVGVITTLVGQSSEAARTACGGPFSIAPVSEDVALLALPALRKSN
jgi:hypothetical protein